MAEDGEILQSFCHPDDSDGCPGDGSAAFSRSIELVPGGGAEPQLEIIGGRFGAEDVLRVDLEGEATGWRVPLREIGGVPGGLTRLSAPDENGSGAVCAVVESSAELQILDLTPPPVFPVVDLTASVDENSVTIAWRRLGRYDAIEIRRDDELVATVAGDSDFWTDDLPPHGNHEYAVVAQDAGCEAGAARVLVVVGAGRVVKFAPFAQGNPLDIAEDIDGNLWVATEVGELAIYNRDLQWIETVPGPFMDEGDVTTGITPGRSGGDSFFVYNSTKHLIAEIDRAGTVIESPFSSGIEASDDAPIQTGPFLFDARGQHGVGSFLVVNYTAGTIDELLFSTSAGPKLIASCIPPDVRLDPPRDDRTRPVLWGLSWVPAKDRLDQPIHSQPFEIATGSLRERGIKRVVRMDRSCSATGARDAAQRRHPHSFGRGLRFRTKRNERLDVWSHRVDQKPGDFRARQHEPTSGECL